MMTREMNAHVTPPPVPAKMKQGVKLRKSVIELVETEKTYIKVVNYGFSFSVLMSSTYQEEFSYWYTGMGAQILALKKRNTPFSTIIFSITGYVPSF